MFKDSTSDTKKIPKRNGPKWTETASNWQKQTETDRNRLKRTGTYTNEQIFKETKNTKTNINGLKRMKKDIIGHKLTETDRNYRNRQKKTGRGNGWILSEQIAGPGDRHTDTQSEKHIHRRIWVRLFRLHIASKIG